MFNVFKFSDALKAGGIDPKVAEAQARAFAEALEDTEVASRGDVREMGAELRAETANLRTELKTDIANLRTELKTDIANLRTELKTDIANLRTELKTQVASLRGEVKQIQWNLSLVIAGLGVVFTILNHFMFHV